jgi:hypothetical protein
MSDVAVAARGIGHSGFLCISCRALCSRSLPQGAGSKSMRDSHH